MEEKKIPLIDIVRVCKDVLADKITEEQLNTFGTAIMVRSEINLLEKSTICFYILNEAKYSEMDNNAAIKTAELIVNKFFYGLIQGYTNIEVDEKLVTIDNYDLVAPIFKKFILQYCQEDYKDLEDMIRDTLQLSNIENIINIFSGINAEVLEKATIETKKTIKSLEKNQTLIENLKDIAAFNDPYLNRAIEEMKKSALEESNKNKKS